jgi:hypothetical protein
VAWLIATHPVHRNWCSGSPALAQNTHRRCGAILMHGAPATTDDSHGYTAFCEFSDTTPA